MKRVWLQNILVILVSLGGASACAYLLYSDLYSNKHTLRGHEAAGQLSEKLHTVRRKLSDTMIFEPVSTDETLYWNDSIQTDHNSGAKIRLADGHVIALGEASLVVLERDADGLSLNLKNGQLVVDSETRAASGARGVKVNGTMLTNADGELVSLKMDENRGVLTATTKNAEGVDKEITVDRDGHREERELLAKLLTPAPLARQFSNGDVTMVRFIWATLSSVSSTLEIAQNDNFTPNVFEKETTGHEFDVNMQPGSYFWRVKSKGDDQKYTFSEVRTLEILKKAAPVIGAPALGEKIFFDSTLPVVEFSWSGGAGVSHYFFEVARDQDFKNIIFDDQTNNTVYRTSKVAEGHVYWRVTAFYGDEGLSQSSSIDLIRRTPAPSPPPIELLAASNLTLDAPEFNSAEIQTKPVNLSWKAVDGARNYNLEVAGDNAFAPPLFKKMIQKNHFESDLKSGVYYLRVQGLDTTGREGLWSKPFRLVVNARVLPITASVPVREVPYIARKPEVEVSWRSQEPANQFQVRVFKDGEFFLKQETTSPSLRFSASGPGYYQVEVSAGIGDQFSAPVTVEKIRVEKKELVSPAWNMADLKTFSSGQPVELRWKATPGADKYRLVIYQEVVYEGSEQGVRIPVASREVITNEVQLPLPQGRYIATIESLSGEKVSPPLADYFFEVK